MVRVKNRWLLVTFAFDPYPPPDDDADGDVLNGYAHPGARARARAVPAPTLSAQEVTALLRASLQANFGDGGAGAAASAHLACRYYSPQLRTAIIRCARESLKVVWAALTLVAYVGARRVRTRVIHVGGTVKKVQLRAIGLDRTALADVQRMLTDEEHSAALPLHPVHALGMDMDKDEEEGPDADLGQVVEDSVPPPPPRIDPLQHALQHAQADQHHQYQHVVDEDDDDLGEPVQL